MRFFFRDAPSTISINRGLLFMLSLILSILIGTTAIQATPAHPFYWEKMDVDLQLVESGDILVTETQKYVFTDRYTNRRTRYIKLDKIDEIKDITVTENNLPVTNLQVSTADGKEQISWEHPAIDKFPKAHTFVLKYRVIGGLEVEDAQTQFRWMAIFPDRQALIKVAKVTLHLPAKLAGFTKDFTTNGVVAVKQIINPTTIEFIPTESIEPQAKLAILGQFPTTALNLTKSHWQSSSSGNWWGWLWIPLVWIFSLFSSGSSSYGGGDGGGDGGGCGGGCGGCGGGD
jgi:uncharacterized membrane protein YgcG